MHKMAAINAHFLLFAVFFFFVPLTQSLSMEATHLNTTLVKWDYCPWLSCSGQCGSRFLGCPGLGCSCDAWCQVINDCCYDFHQVCLEDPQFQVDENNETFQRYEAYQSLSTLEEFPVNGKEGLPQHVQIVSSCPTDTITHGQALEAGQSNDFDIKQLERLCHSFNFSHQDFNHSALWRDLPVLSDRHVFKNVYCAKCHGNRGKYITPLPIKFQCEDSVAKEISQNKLAIMDLYEYVKLCSWVLDYLNIHPDSARFFKFPTVIETCNPALASNISFFEQLEKDCHGYKAVILHLLLLPPETAYRNVHCSLCNGEHINEYSMCPVTDCNRNNGFRFPATAVDSLFSFSLLVDFTQSGNGVALAGLRVVESGNLICPEGTKVVYGSKGSACIDIGCKEDEEREGRSKREAEGDGGKGKQVRKKRSEDLMGSTDRGIKTRGEGGVFSDGGEVGGEGTDESDGETKNSSRGAGAVGRAGGVKGRREATTGVTEVVETNSKLSKPAVSDPIPRHTALQKQMQDISGTHIEDICSIRFSALPQLFTHKSHEIKTFLVVLNNYTSYHSMVTGLYDYVKEFSAAYSEHQVEQTRIAKVVDFLEYFEEPIIYPLQSYVLVFRTRITEYEFLQKRDGISKLFFRHTKDTGELYFINWDADSNIDEKCPRGKFLRSRGGFLVQSDWFDTNYKDPRAQNQDGVLNFYNSDTGFYYRLEDMMVILKYKYQQHLDISGSHEMSFTTFVCYDPCEGSNKSRDIQAGVAMNSLEKYSEKQQCKLEETQELIDPHPRIQSILTLIGNFISMAALLPTFCMLLSDRPHKVSMKVMVINLILALFIAQFTFQMQGVFIDTIICSTIAMLQHYFWLAYFFIMNAIAMDIALRFKSLSSMVLGQASNHSQRLVCLLCHGWGVPLIIVTFCIVVNTFDYFPLGYGEGGSCWISDPRGLLYFFVIPFMCTVGCNIILLVATMITIYTRSTAIQSQLTSHDRHHFRSYMKLVTLMGSTWTVALYANYTGTQFFWYLFILLNTLQGVFLFIAFFPMKRVASYVSQSTPKRTVSTSKAGSSGRN